MTLSAHEIIEEIQAKAFQEGWEALARKILAVLKETPTTKSPPHRSVATKLPFKDGTMALKIYDYMRSNPGLTASEIIHNTGADDKSARTTLHRMKTRGIAKNEDRKWSIL